MRILNFGSLNIDYIYAVDHIVEGGETISSWKLEEFVGGKGLNQSIALAKAGMDVYHAGMVGDEGQILLDTLHEKGVNTKHVRIGEGKSGHAIIQLADNGENCIVLYGGANRMLTKQHIDEVLDCFGKEDVLILQNETNLVWYLIEQAKKRGMRIAFNPSPFDKNVAECDLRKVDIFLINQIEGSQLTGEDECDVILEKMYTMFPDAIVVLTLGEKGSAIICKDGTFRHDVFKTSVVDTTGAGDTYTGYILMGLLQKKDYRTAMKLASKAAAIAVSVKGAANSIPCIADVEKSE